MSKLAFTIGVLTPPGTPHFASLAVKGHARAGLCAGSTTLLREACWTHNHCQIACRPHLLPANSLRTHANPMCGCELFVPTLPPTVCPHARLPPSPRLPLASDSGVKCVAHK